MTRYDVVSFGEGQIRLTAPRGENVLTARQLYITAAGSEANVTGLLSQLGHSCAWGSVIPQGELGDRIVREYRAAGTDVSQVVRPEEGRVALYFLQPGEEPMPAEVIYDRLHTPFREVEPSMFNWEVLLDTKILFITGITLALTDKTRALLNYAVQQARQRGARIALDVNHRTRLWSAQQARETLLPLLDQVDVLFCSRADGNTVFGIEGTGDRVAATLRRQHRIPIVVSTSGHEGVFLSTEAGEESFEVCKVNVVDRPGAGDAFIAGTLHGYLNDDLQLGVRTGLKAAQYALSHYGDLVSLREKGLEITSSGNSDILR